MSVKSDSPSRPGGCSCRKITSRSAPFRPARHGCAAPACGEHRRRSRDDDAGSPRNGHRSQAWGALQHRHYLAVPNLSQRIATSAATRRFLLRRQPWILLDAIGGGGAEPGLGRGDGRRLGSAETHVQPHLAVGDVAARQAAFLIGVKNPLPIGRPRPPDNTAPCGAPPVARFATPVGLRPPFVTHPATLPHPD